MILQCFVERTRCAAVRGPVLVFLFIFSVPTDAPAQSRLDPVVVTATREPRALGLSVADVVVIDSERIRNSTADSVEDLLRREAGVQLTRSGGPGQPSGYLVRGASTSSTLVLIDGVRVGAATLGQVQLEALSLAQVDRIEVLRGPASSLYGADAVGGVIQIFTRRGDGAPRVSGGAAIGNHRSWQADIGIGGSQAGFDYAASIGHERSGGTSALRRNDAFGNFNPDDDGFSRTFGNARLGYAPAAGHRVGIDVVASRLNAQYDASEFNPPSFAQDATPDFRNRLRMHLAAIDYRGAVSGAWTTTLRVSQQLDDATSGGTVFSRFQTRREQATWQNALRLGAGQQLVLAYEHLRERVSGDVFADEPKRRNDAIVAGYTGGAGGIGFETSVRHDDNSAYGANTTGSIGASWTVAPGLKLRTLGGTTFRAPTFNDLYFPGFGVATVRPERGRSVELGVSWERADASVSATLFRNRVNDLIGYQPDRAFCPPDPAFDFGCAGNVGRARLQGATIGAARRWGAFRIRATVDLLDALDLDTGTRLSRRAAHQESLAADCDAGAWRFGATLLSVGSRPDAGAVLGGYVLVDLRAAWRLAPRWRLEAKLLNALDRDVEPVRDYRGLGRQAWLGVRYDGAGL